MHLADAGCRQGGFKLSGLRINEKMLLKCCSKAAGAGPAVALQLRRRRRHQASTVALHSQSLCSRTRQARRRKLRLRLWIHIAGGACACAHAAAACMQVGQWVSVGRAQLGGGQLQCPLLPACVRAYCEVCIR